MKLKRCLGFRETVTITTGTVIGVGLFTVGAGATGVLGNFVIFATLFALLISIYPSMLYAEMSAALPLTGGTYRYASIGLGRFPGVLAGFCFLISMTAVASGEALAFSFYFRTILDFFGVSLPISDRIIAAAVILLFVVLAIRGVELSGRMQNAFLFFFWGVSLVWIVSVLPNLQYSGNLPLSGSVAAAFLPCAAMVWWCFAGFETCCALGEEIRHPQVVLPRALIVAPFVVFAVTGLFQWALLRLVPPEALATAAGADAPFAAGMQAAGIVGAPLVLLCTGIAFGGDFSTLNAGISAPARYLFMMAQEGVLPGFLRGLGTVDTRFCTPKRAILVLGGAMLVLVWGGSIPYIASLSLFATLLYYIVGMAAACGLRKRLPELARPFRAPGLRLGAPLSIFLYLAMMTQLDRGAVLLGLGLCLILLAAYAHGHGREGLQCAAAPKIETDPLDPAEKKRMDREYRIWTSVTAAACLAILLLHLGLLV